MTRTNEIHSSEDRSPPHEEQEIEAVLSWWYNPIIGKDFSLDHEFITEDSTSTESLARNTVQLIQAANIDFYSSDTREQYNLPVSNRAFAEQLYPLYQRMQEYARMLEALPVAQLEYLPQEKPLQHIVALGALAKWAVQYVSLKGYFLDEDLFSYFEPDSKYGLMEASLPPLLDINISRYCVEQDPIITPADTERVLEALTCFVSTKNEPALLTRLKRENLERARYMLQGKETLALADILELHATLLAGIQANIGKLRTRHIMAGSELRKLRPLEPSLITEEILLLLAKVNTINVTSSYQDVAQIAAEFQRIHPLGDGNGRVGHLVTNFALSRAGLPTFWVPREMQKRYIYAMDTAIGDSNYDELINLMREYAEA